MKVEKIHASEEPSAVVTMTGTGPAGPAGAVTSISLRLWLWRRVGDSLSDEKPGLLERRVGAAEPGDELDGHDSGDAARHGNRDLVDGGAPNSRAWDAPEDDDAGIPHILRPVMVTVHPGSAARPAGIQIWLTGS